MKIGLDASETRLEPQNPNIRGGHFGDGDKDPLDEIVRAFNERHFAGWEATPEEQRVKFINIAKHVISHADYKAQVEDNPSRQAASTGATDSAGDQRRAAARTRSLQAVCV